MSKKMRDSNIELLRILAVMGVILLHFNGIYGHAFEYVEAGSAKDYVLRYLECLSAPAVNVFVLISGYYLCDSYRREVIKPMCLITQVILFREMIYLLTVLQNGIFTFSVKSAVGALIPNNYYVILYITLYFVSPYINLALQRLTDKQWKVFLSTIMISFSAFPTAVDVLQEISHSTFYGLNPIGRLGDQGGYTIVQFCLMYVIGAYLRREKTQRALWQVVAMLATCSLLLLVWSKLLPQTAWIYCNPLVILEAILVFALFERIHMESKWINCASKAVFTCFLCHGIFLKMLPVERMVQKDLWMLLPLLAAILIGIYVLCLGIHCVYHYLEKYVIKNILKIFEKVVLDLEPSKEGETCK